MQTEKAFMNMRRISPKEHVPFRCTGCGECCRHVHQSIPLESLDVYHIARYEKNLHLLKSALNALADRA